MALCFTYYTIKAVGSKLSTGWLKESAIKRNPNNLTGGIPMGSNDKRKAAQERNQREGEQINVGNGQKATINPTSDPKYPNAEYVTITNSDGTKADSTMIVDSGGNILNEAK